MPVAVDELTNAASVSGTVSAAEVSSLATDRRMKFVQVRSDVPRRTWQTLNAGLFAKRRDVTLSVDSFWPGGADLSLLRHVPDVRRLSVTSVGMDKIASLESIAELPDLEALQIGSPTLASFDVLNVLPPETLRELRLADTMRHKPSLAPVARFTPLKSLRIEGHSADLDAVRSLRSLRRLDLAAIRLRDFDLLRALPKLASFSFASGGVKDAGALAELDRLQHFGLFRSTGFESLAFLAAMRGLGLLWLEHLPKATAFPDLSQLTKLRRVCLANLKRLEGLTGLAKAPALEGFMHLAVSPAWTPNHFLCLLEHPTLRRFTAIIGSARRDNPIKELAARMGKAPASGTPEHPFIHFKL